MKLPGGAIVTRALEDEGIELAFGIPGTHNIELYDALAESERVRSVLVTDEQSASFMADGAWRASGRMACVNLVPGAGLTHALSGIAEAYLDQVPMLVLGCGIRRDVRRAFQLHDVDQEAIARPVVKATYRPESGAALYRTVREACRVARAAPPGPVFVEVPVNLYLFTHDVDLEGERRAFEAADAPALPAPDADALARAVALLRAAKRPLLYVGAGAIDAGAEVVRLAETLEAPVSTTFTGKGVIPEDHPLFLWPGYGHTAPAFARTVADGCDVTVAVGCRFSEVGTGSYALEPKGPLIHIDADADAIGANFPAEVALVTDARVGLRALLEALGGAAPRGPDTRLRDAIRTGHEALRREWLSGAGGPLVTPAHLLAQAQEVFGADAVYATDSGNGTFIAMEALRLAGPRRYLAPVDYSCMGYAVPAALGAKLACPERPVVALAGDGAFLMTGLELLTGVQEGAGVVVLLLRDRELAQIAQFQSTAMNRKTKSAVHDYDAEHLAAGMRVPFLRISTDDEVRPALEEASAVAEGGTPVLVEVAIDYSRKTLFTRGVVKANLHRLPLRDRVRFVGRALTRRFTE